MSIYRYLEKRGGAFWLAAGFILVSLVAWLDALTGYEVSFSLFYLLPIALAAWFGGRRCGILVTFLSVMGWIVADDLAGHAYSHPAIQYWNGSIRLGFFLSTALLVSALKAALDREQGLSRIDSLTGAANKRQFNERLQTELKRARRYGHPLTLAYVDLDNFKQVNDDFGHSEGDKVLFTIVQKAQEALRTSDMVARLGGDEFAFLLPETGEAEARVCMEKIRAQLLEEMQMRNWPVSFSIGVLTCLADVQSEDALIRQADQLMYAVKNSGKNAIRYSTLEG